MHIYRLPPQQRKVRISSFPLLKVICKLNTGGLLSYNKYPEI